MPRSGALVVEATALGDPDGQRGERLVHAGEVTRV